MILITGAAGFIGSNLVAALNEAGRDDLVLCDWLAADGRWENLAKRCFHDLLRPDQLAAFLDGPRGATIETILHMGAITDTGASDGDLVMERNYQGTKMLWAWCATRGRRLVYASSAATYGDGGAGFDDRLDLAALKRLRPLNLYAWSKHMFDLFAVANASAPPPHWYGLKFFNVFGPNEYHKGPMRSVVCKLAPDIITGRPAQLFASHRTGYADGGQLRDFVHVDDVCRIVRHFADATPPSGLYNVGTGTARSFADLVAAAYKAVGHDPAIAYIPMPELLQRRYQYVTQADTTKLRASGYVDPFPSLETSVAGYMNDYLVRDDRYR